MLKFGVLALTGLVLLAGTSLWAQQPQDPIGANLFPPDLVMQHQQAIGLSEDQRTALKGEIQKAQMRFTDLQWQLQSEMETMVGLVKQGRVDEQRALAQLDKVMAVEGEIKRAQMGLLIRVKNLLTPEQQAALQTIRSH